MQRNSFITTARTHNNEVFLAPPPMKRLLLFSSFLFVLRANHRSFHASFCCCSQLLILLAADAVSAFRLIKTWYINSLWRRHICRCAFSSPLIDRKLHCTFAVSIQKSSKTSPHPSDSISSAHSSLLVARELFFSVALEVSESEFSGQNSGVGVGLVVHVDLDHRKARMIAIIRCSNNEWYKRHHAVIDLKSKEIRGFPSSLLISQTGEIYRNWAHHAPLTSNSLEVAKFGFASMRKGTVSHNFMNDLKVSRHFPIIFTSCDIIFCRKLILTDTLRSFSIIFECVLNNVLLPPLKNITITPFLSLTRYLHSRLKSNKAISCWVTEVHAHHFCSVP